MELNPDRDPVLLAFALWNENGWPETAHGMAAVTSVLRVHQMLNRRADQLLAPMALNFARYQVLVMLYFGGGSSPMTHLGRNLGLHQTTITHLVDKLEQMQLVRRIPHPTDRRSTIAEMTARGRSATQQAIARLNADLFGDLGLTTDENRLLTSLLAKMRQAGDEFGGDPEWATPASPPPERKVSPARRKTSTRAGRPRPPASAGR